MTLEEFKGEVRAGNTAGASPVPPSSPSGVDVKRSLLAAVGKPTRSYHKGEFIELARRVVAADRKAP